MAIELFGSDWPRKILHIDLDAFYPSVEVLDNPELAGKQVIVGGLGRRGVVSSASYEAREHGVHSAMPMAEARRRCPDAVYLPPRFRRYRELSQQVFAIYDAWSDQVEPLSLDEAYLDVSGHMSSPVDIAKSIRSSIHRKTGLTASAGVSYNKFLAKLASDFDKPDGLTVISPVEAVAFLRNLPVGKLWGVGPATAAKLADAGFTTIGEIAQADPEVLTQLIGKGGKQVWEFANGRDERPVQRPSRPKSISEETTFERDLPSWEKAWPSLEKFAEDVSRSLGRWGLSARTVVLKVRFQDFKTITRSYTSGNLARHSDDLLQAAQVLVGRVPLDGRRIRLVGLGVSNLADEHDEELPREEAGTPQMSLWDSI
jgi:DNA polymerase-4